MLMCPLEQCASAEAGRLVVTPHPLTTDGQRNVACDLLPGESLGAFLRRHVPDIEQGGWRVTINDAVVPPHMWEHTWPKHGTVIAVRSALAKSAMQLVAIAALVYITWQLPITQTVGWGVAGGIQGITVVTTVALATAINGPSSSVVRC